MIEIEKGKLDKATCYLSGAMEMVEDNGVGWRRRIIRQCKEAGLKIDFLDPTDKPGGKDVKIGEDQEYQVRLQKEGKFKELKKYVHQYRRFDLDFVDGCDFQITFIDPTVAQWGTANEVYLGEAQHDPHFFICEGGLYNLPRWLFDVIDLDDHFKKTRCNVFESTDEVVKELLGYDCNAIPMHEEWILFRRELESRRSES